MLLLPPLFCAAMSEARTHAEFTELWRTVSKLSYKKTQDTKAAKQMPDTTTTPVSKGEAVCLLI